MATAQHYARPISEEFHLDLPRIDPEPERDDGTTTGTCYAGDLRVIGQMIEQYSFTRLHVEVADGHYQIRGSHNENRPPSSRVIERLSQWLGSQDWRAKIKTKGSETTWQVTAPEINAANMLNQKNRQNSGDAPDPCRISQVLRGAGFYLDTRQQAKLKWLSINDTCVSFEYQTIQGKQVIVEKKFDFFYDYLVNMYKRRGQRQKIEMTISA